MADSFESQTRSTKVAIAVFIPAALGALGFFVVIQPRRSGLAEAQAAYQTLQSSFLAGQQQQREYLQLKETLDRREAMDRRNQRVLPETAEIASFLQDLNRLAELNGLKIRLVEPLAEEPDNLYVRLPVRLGLSGRYHQVAKFFFDISQNDRVINMENVALGAPKLEGDELILQVDVRATTFRLQLSPPPVDAKAAGNAKGAVPPVRPAKRPETP